MKIQVSEEHDIILRWDYKIRKQKKMVKGVEYAYYSASFPTELQTFLDTRDVWLKENEGNIFLFPVEEEDSKKIRISTSGKESFSFSLPKDLFPLLEEKNFVRIVFDGESIVLSLF